MHKRIVYTRHDGGVSVCCPSDWAVAVMGCGGLWNGFSRGFLETQIERQIARGVKADAARRYANAMQFGGCTTAEALEIIRDRDCAHLGTAIELWDVDEVPTDRWFRNAWRRSPNGGPIMVDLNKAKPIQFTRIKRAVDAENKRRANDLERFGTSVDVDLPAMRDRIIRARDEAELRMIWPDGL